MTTMQTLDELDGQPHANVFPDREPKTVRLSLDADESVPAHSHSGRDIVLYLVEGEVELQLGDRTHELMAGEIARFEGEQEISPRAVEPSVALIVLAPRSE
jgi:quercetin dioxygenase-like cupin family protein